MPLALLDQVGIRIERVSSEAMKGMVKDVADMKDSGLDFGVQDHLMEPEKVVL